MMRGTVLTCVLLAVASATARADEGRLLGDDTFAVSSKGSLLVDGGLFVGQPSVLPAGISSGIGAGITRECGCTLSYGARASWSQLTDSDEQWVVTHQEYRLRASGAVRHAFGRGTLSLRLDLGTTVVHEDRVRTQSARLMGGSFESKAIAALPAGELEAVVGLHVTGTWLLVASGGPALDYYQKLRGGWIAQLGVAWQP